MTVEPDRLWDAWRDARRTRAGLALEEFAREEGLAPEHVRAVLAPLLALERGSPPPPLVDLAPGGAGAFAGFRLVHGLGQGSSGMVFLARDERTPDGGLVALKILNPLLAAAPERRDAILREAEIAGRLDHGNVVRVLGSGVERGYAWIATEYVDGERLDVHAARFQTPAERVRCALDVGTQLAAALAHAHAHGVVHRDLKPANVLVSREGRVRVLDFGLARSDGTAFALSSTGEMVGTPLYMAPEQVRGSGVGPWSDVWALGLMLWEVASGRPLDAPSSFSDLMRAIERGALRPRASSLRSLGELQAVLARCLELHPADRYRDASAFQEDLAALRRGASLPHGALSRMGRWHRRIRRHPFRATMLSTGAVAALALGAWSWHMRPVDVYFNAQRTGRIVSIDGEVLGIVPQVARLRPGLHRWELRFPNRVEVFEGKFVVRSGEPRFEYPILQPAVGSPEIDIGTRPDAPAAWVQFATPEDEIRLIVDGVFRGVQPGIAAFRLPLGRHAIRLELAGSRPFEREVDLADQHLCFLPHEFDAEDDPWRTVLLYGPFDEAVRRATVSANGVRLFYEEKNHPERSGVYRNYAYFGPSDAGVPGFIEVAVDLPAPVGDLELSVMNNSVCVSPDALVTLEFARPGGTWLPAVEWRGQEVPVGARKRVHDPFDCEGAFRYEIDADRTAAIAAATRGATRLRVRWTVFSADAGGDSCAYACALRPHPLPSRTPDGALQWGPALRIRVRPAPQFGVLAPTEPGICHESGLSCAGPVGIPNPRTPVMCTTIDPMRQPLPKSPAPASRGVQAALCASSISTSVIGQLLLAGLAGAQVPCRDLILPPQPAAGGGFGAAVSVLSDTLAVAAPGDPQGGVLTGAVDVFTRVGSAWQHEARLQSNPPSPGAQFGVSVSVGTDRLAVGALEESSGAGAVYVFDRVAGQWGQTARLVASDSAPDRLFGYSVDLDGDRLVAGSPAGAAYVFENGPTGWSEVQRVTGSDTHGWNDRFGQSVSLEGDTLIVGAYLRADAGSKAGAVYVFRLIAGAWQQQVKLEASDASAGAEFGNWVHLSGGTLVVSAPFYDFPDWGTGATYVFREIGGAWTEEARLAPADLALGDRFGYAATNGSQIVAATQFHDQVGVDAGAAYLYEREAGAWVERGKLVVPGNTAGDQFGRGRALQGATLALGAHFSDLAGPNAGAVYVYDLSNTACWANCGGNNWFDTVEIESYPGLDINVNGELDECECDVTAYCTGSPNSTGVGASIGYAGTVSIANDDLVLLCSGLPPNTSGTFYFGPNQLQVPFGHGFRCVSGPLWRTGVVTASATGNAARAVSYGDAPFVGRLVPLSTWNFQFWYRNTAAGVPGFNLSDALSIHFCP